MTYSLGGIPYTHNKTGNRYYLLNGNVTECTNGREDIKYAVYCNEQGRMFCREYKEFCEKFTRCECNK